MPAFFESINPIDTDENPIVMATRITVRRPGHALAVIRKVNPMRDQLRETPGLRRYGLKADLLRMQFTTFAVFDDRPSLSSFIRSGVHGEAMRVLGGRLHRMEARTSTVASADIPTDWQSIEEFLNSGQNAPSVAV